MRLFNPVTMTEAIPGMHDLTGAVELADDNWFFIYTEIPKGKMLRVDKYGFPILINEEEANY
ncbi:hypothetical protein [Kalamiella sp. sgz302252]|uniref:hypothetical protein n=1 Tax=Pantoea sp. sgz302252 TaxID=3341827 RepID=UPI0036D2FA7C